MSLDSYVTLGRSGLRVSPLCLGAMTFGKDASWGASVTDSKAIMARYVEQGGNFVDTANGYTMGHSEVIIGDYLKSNPGLRYRLVIATTFSSNLFPGDPNGGGGSRKSIVAAAQESLRHLRVDYIDLYWLHHWDKFTPIDETLRALDDLVASGKVRYIGASDTPAWYHLRDYAQQNDHSVPAALRTWLVAAPARARPSGKIRSDRARQVLWAR